MEYYDLVGLGMITGGLISVLLVYFIVTAIDKRDKRRWIEAKESASQMLRQAEALKNADSFNDQELRTFLTKFEPLMIARVDPMEIARQIQAYAENLQPNQLSNAAS